MMIIELYICLKQHTTQKSKQNRTEIRFISYINDDS